MCYQTSDVPGGVRPAEGRSQHGSEGRGRVHFQIGPSKKYDISDTTRQWMLKIIASLVLVMWQMEC